MISQNYDIIKDSANYLTLCKKKHDIQKITDCIRSNSEKGDRNFCHEKSRFVQKTSTSGKPALRFSDPHDKSHDVALA